MASLDETLSRLAASTPKITVDETLRLLRPSIPDDPSTSESTQQAVEKRLVNLARQTFVLMRHKRNISEANAKLEAEARQLRDALSRFNRPCIPPHVLIRFVSTLEEAHRYFDFKIRAMQAHVFEHLSSPDDVSRILLQDGQLLSEFPKIGDTQLKEAAHAIFWELYYRHLGSKDAHPFQDSKLHDWVYRLAFKTREQGYAIDIDPIVELEKLREYAPFVYKDYFLSQQLPVECTDDFISQQLPVECTEISEQEALNNYPKLVSSMLAKSKEASHEKLKFLSTATNPRNKEAVGEKPEVTTTATIARHKEAFSEKHELGVTYVVSSTRKRGLQ